jgi:transcriptional/translational regulatory protein YebC/TACO1
LDVPADRIDALEEVVIEAGADDYTLGDGFAVVYTSRESLHEVKDALEATGFPVESAKIERVPNQPIEIGDEEVEKLSKLLDAFDENDDVSNVYTNLPE